MHCKDLACHGLTLQKLHVKHQNLFFKADYAYHVAMDIPLSSEKSPGGAHLCRNSSPPLTPLLHPILRQPTLHIISYDRAAIPTTPLLLQYDLQSQTDQSRHICANPSMGVSRSTMLKLRAEPNYASQLLAAEREIRNAMECLQRAIAFRTRSSSTSSGDVVADWVEGLEHHGVDGDPNGAVMNRFVDEFGVGDESVQRREYPDLDGDNYFSGGKAEMPVLSVGCSCANGCHKSVAFAEELASKQWPGDWAVKVEHGNVTPEAHGNSDWKN